MQHGTASGAERVAHLSDPLARVAVRREHGRVAAAAGYDELVEVGCLDGVRGPERKTVE
ncbi:MAG: hypothetical protein LBE08_11850 [Bifidobacteriaceae bacterium]|jgi:hypothetical protein|nr:hypothetical protein [Bifidobacteriaceae bacterium]